MTTHIDMVCGMQIDEKDVTAQSKYLGETYYFCSETCKHKFDQRPEDYVVRSRTGNNTQGHEV